MTALASPQNLGRYWTNNGQRAAGRSNSSAANDPIAYVEQVNAPPPKGGGFGLRLKAGLVRHLADSSLTTSTTPQLPRNHCSTSSTATRHARQYPVCAGEREKDQHRYAVPHPMPPEGVGFPRSPIGDSEICCAARKPLPLCHGFHPLRCLVLCLGQGNEAALKSGRQSRVRRDTARRRRQSEPVQPRPFPAERQARKQTLPVLPTSATRRWSGRKPRRRYYASSVRRRAN